MYTRYRGTLPRLRAYHRELTTRYLAALARRDWAGAREVYDRRHRVWVAILRYEEWNGEPPTRLSVPAESLPSLR